MAMTLKTNKRNCVYIYTHTRVIWHNAKLDCGTHWHKSWVCSKYKWTKAKKKSSSRFTKHNGENTISSPGSLANAGCQNLSRCARSIRQRWRLWVSCMHHCYRQDSGLGYFSSWAVTTFSESKLQQLRPWVFVKLNRAKYHRQEVQQYIRGQNSSGVFSSMSDKGQ